jgi:hypothetical protein
VRRIWEIVLLCLLAFATAAPPSPATVTPTTRGRAIVVAKRPFFPIMQWSQCPSDFASSLLLGINVFMGSCEDVPADVAAAMLGRHGYVVPPIELRGSLPGARVLGWHQPDEPENLGLPASALAEPRRARGPTFLTLTSEFMQRARGPSAYQAYTERADVVGFDLYPIAAHCKTHISLADVYNGQRDLLALAPGKPTYQWIETGPLDGRCTRRGPVTPEEVRAEIWLAIAGGATGIGYFTHTWTRGTWFRFDVPFPIRPVIERTNRELRALAPVLLSSQLEAAATEPVYVGARAYRDAVYVIAVNASAAPVAAEIQIPPDLQLSTVDVWGGGGDARAEFTDGVIRDTFGPLEPRVFILRR